MDIFVLFGQTATGKTAEALRLVDQHNGEIINFDSRQIYKKLNIVTGKDIPKNTKFKLPSESLRTSQIQIQNKSIGYYELPPTKLWLYDIIDPKEIFSSAEYVQVAEEVLKDIFKRGKTPVLVGGTGYYLRHLLFGIPEMKIKEDWMLRKQLETKTVEELQMLLKEQSQQLLDEMNNSDRNNPRRLIRRIEIAKNGGMLPPVPKQETLTARLANLGGLQQGTTITYLPYFHATTDAAREKITLRVEQRIADGAIEEVKQLLSSGYTKSDPGLNAIGYSQIIEYIENKLTLSEMKKQWITREVQYAKRQKTYFTKYFPQEKESLNPHLTVY